MFILRSCQNETSDKKRAMISLSSHSIYLFHLSGSPSTFATQVIGEHATFAKYVWPTLTGIDIASTDYPRVTEKIFILLFYWGKENFPWNRVYLFSSLFLWFCIAYVTLFRIRATRMCIHHFLGRGFIEELMCTLFLNLLCWGPA